jgi:hypothetical protein
MTRQQLQRAFQIAKQRNSKYDSLDWAVGFGLSDYEPMHITVEMLANLISYQCACLDGSWDQAALNEIAEHGKRKFVVID